MYNPMLDYQRNQLLAQQQLIQNQLNQMPTNQPTFNPYPQPTQPQFVVKQVGNYEEAKGFVVEPNVMYFFPDTGTGKIYLKKLNTDTGKSDFYTYKVEETNNEPKVEVNPMDEINKKLTDIQNTMGGLYESVSSFTRNVKSDEKPSGGNATTNASKDAKSKPSNV